MPVKNKITIITINYNNYSDTIECIDSIYKLNISNILLDIIVVDNGSTDNSFNLIKNKYPKIISLRLNNNLGFATAANHGIKQSLNFQPDYILLINNDCLIKDSEFLQNLLKKTSDITAPLIQFVRQGKTIIDYGGKIDWLFARNTHLYQPNKPDYLSGVCLLIKPEVFSRIGFFNSKYFLYYEDADFCLRAKKANLTLSTNQHITVFHKLSASSKKLGKKKMAILADSQLIFAKKHLSILSTPLYYFYHFYLKLKSL